MVASSTGEISTGLALGTDAAKMERKKPAGGSVAVSVMVTHAVLAPGFEILRIGVQFKGRIIMRADDAVAGAGSASDSRGGGRGGGSRRGH